MNEIEKKLKYYRNILFKLKNNKEQIQETGFLVKVNRKRKVYYYHEYKEGDITKRKYLSKDSKKLFSQLAQKYYNKKLLSFLTKKIKYSELLNKYYDERSLEDIVNLCSKEIRENIDTFFVTKDQKIQKWKNFPFDTNNYQKNHCIYPTECGHMVRSKSENMISDILTYRELIHVYEIKLELDDGPVYPDFAIIHPKTLEIIYWEHNGLMDDSQYRNEALKKIQRYERNGIIRGKNLIVTFESREVPFNKEWINKIIDSMFFGK